MLFLLIIIFYLDFYIFYNFNIKFQIMKRLTSFLNLLTKIKKAKNYIFKVKVHFMVMKENT